MRSVVTAWNARSPRSETARIVSELCAAPKEGGLTPSFGVLRSVREHITIPIHPIIRPRGGDFYYTDGEFAAMLEDIRLVRELGFPGLVTGVLTVDGDVDMSRMEKIMAAAGPLAVTFHRAFDMCANPFNALKNLADAGVARVLTSGAKSRCGARFINNYGTYCPGGCSNHYGWCGGSCK
ncbi:putative copper homeostasis protein [Salmonella enterica subsp. enterica]|uniref:Copper homeostasis protein cutC homolog n=1 Tax=Salmonella enterica I TaxID=59201 RepID=A0A447N8U1_SALET|nr:putative copper homeostasis protein [Salmonella enterica subsp. enterica]